MLVLEAAIVAGEAGIGATEAAAALSLHEKPTGVDRANAGRTLKALVTDGLLEPHGKGRWRAVEGADSSMVPDRSGSQPGVLSGLPEAPPGAEPPRRGRPKQIDRVRALVERGEELDRHLTADERHRLRVLRAVHGIDDWRLWLPAMFPRLFTAEFAPHHAEYWDWLWAIEAGKPVDPFVAVWNRGGAKSASAEAGLVACAARGVRRYGWYVSATQDLADDHVANVGSLFQSEELEAAYPGLGERLVGKYGESKGWRRNRLRTAHGFTLDALGLDVAARGTRLEEQRPDVIVLDDIDSEHDTPAQTEKKIRTITRKLLPAGSQDCAVIAIQNLIHSQSIFARLTNQPGAPKVDFLSKRRISGPVPAVWNMEWRQQGDSYEIVAGEASWKGMPIEACQSMLDLYGLTAFLVECQHEEADLSGGMFDHLDFEAIRVSKAEVPVLRAVGCWVDPAVTSHDRSDSCGIVIDGLGKDRKYYRLWSWERIASPVETLKVAILAAIEFGAQVVGVETDQGGDTWRTVYQSALRDLMDDGQIPEGVRVPRFESAKAGTTQLSKTERAARMLADYEVGRFRHVEGGVAALEAGLRRFPAHKPFDCVDACMVAGTVVLTEHGDVPIEAVLVGDRVWTREGWRAVVASGPTAWDVPTVEVSTEQGSFRCTPDHRVWTVEAGWVPAAEVDGFTLLAWTRDNGSWDRHRLKSATGAASIAATRTAHAMQPSTSTLRARAQGAPNHSTVRSTSTRTVRSPKVTTSTTSTSTRSTTTRATSRRSAHPTTSESTVSDGTTKPGGLTSTESGRSLPNGTDQRKGSSGIASMVPPRGLTEPSTPSSASSVGRSSRRLWALLGSALRRAATERGCLGPKRKRAGSASSAASPSLLSGGRRPVSAVSSVATVRPAERAPVVYDLEVEGCHEFVAGGLLVHNSYWSWRWLAEQGGEGHRTFRARAPRGSVGEINAGAVL